MLVSYSFPYCPNRMLSTQVLDHNHLLSNVDCARVTVCSVCYLYAYIHLRLVLEQIRPARFSYLSSYWDSNII